MAIASPSSTITAASASRSHITNAVTGRWNHIDSDESSCGIVASDRAANEPTVAAGSLAKAPTIARIPSTIGGRLVVGADGGQELGDVSGDERSRVGTDESDHDRRGQSASGA